MNRRVLDKQLAIAAILIFALFAVAAQAAPQPVVQLEEAFSITTLRTNGNTIIAAATDGTIRRFAASSGKKTGEQLKLPGRISDFVVTGEGERLLISSDKVYVVSLSDNSLSMVDAPKAVVVAADYAGLVGAGATGYTIVYYNLTTNRSILSFRAPSEVYSIAIDNAAMTLYAAGKDGIVRAYSIPGGEPAWEYQTNLGAIRSLAVSSDKIIVGGEKGSRLISRTGANIKELARHTDTVRTVAVTPDGRFALTGGDDGIPVVWDINGSRADNINIDPKMPVTAAAIDPYFRYAAVASAATGDMGGFFTIQYMANKRETRRIYIFRDATLTLNGAGYADGTGVFGKYLSYKDGSRKYEFGDISATVHKPEKLDYAMPIPKISQPASIAADASAKTAPIDTAPPVISLNERGFGVITEGEITVIEGRITDESGVAWAKIDEKPLKLSPDGKFKIEVVAPKSGKKITISAADVYGNSTAKSFMLGAGGAEINASKGRKVALLIGINGYKHLPALRTPEYGVKITGEILRGQYGYEVVQLTGVKASRDGIMSEINRLRKSLREEDSFILYYAGHGYLDAETGNPFWQPYDADPAEDTRWILTSQITSALSAYAARQILIISDSCYSGVESGYVKEGANLRALISSGGNEPVTDDGAQGHSVFTQALISALKQAPDNSETLFEMIKMSIPPETKQNPKYQRLSGKGEYLLSYSEF